MKAWTLKHGDCAELLAALPMESVDALVTDPPAGIGFMGKTWDADMGGRDVWIAWLKAIMRSALRVLKPGGHALVWALPRTSHWTATALEDAGFEVRDVLVHLFGTGFPKHQGALKPAAEHWILCRKPLIGTVAGNVAKWGTGGLNIDGCRIESAERLVRPPVQRFDNNAYGKGLGSGTQTEPSGRWPANVLLDESAAAELDAQTEGTRASKPSNTGTRFKPTGMFPIDSEPVRHDDSGGASRFFYVAKPSRKERGDGNVHPTVKSTALMRWLCRLITPPGGTVLDPFAGSGSTGVACLAEGFRFIGFEREAEYMAIAKKRIAGAELPLFREAP